MNIIQFQSYLTFLFAILFLNLIDSYGQDIKFRTLSLSQIPNVINYEGKIKEAIGWTDKLGDNILLTTETGKFPTKGLAEGQDAELYAYHFLLIQDSLKSTWRIYDYIKACNLDMEARFVNSSLSLTDLNNDKIAEIWVVYRLSCHGDVSPSVMKVIMYQGKKKFAMRGNTKLKIGEEFQGGDYAFDNSFVTGPKEFKEFAKQLWNKNVMQDYE